MNETYEMSNEDSMRSDVEFDNDSVRRLEEEVAWLEKENKELTALVDELRLELADLKRKID